MFSMSRLVYGNKLFRGVLTRGSAGYFSSTSFPENNQNTLRSLDKCVLIVFKRKKGLPNRNMSKYATRLPHYTGSTYLNAAQPDAALGIQAPSACKSIGALALLVAQRMVARRTRQAPWQSSIELQHDPMCRPCLFQM